MNTINHLVSALPEDAEWYVCIIPGEKGIFRLFYGGITPEEAVKILYRTADDVLEQQVPLPVKKSLN